jgi:hypothetical protein
MKAMGCRRVLVFALVFLVGWPAVAQAQDGLVIEPAQHDFGEVLAGTETSGVLEVWNDGSQAVTLGGIGFAGEVDAFSFDTEEGCSRGLVLDPGWGCDLGVTFAPQHRGDHMATVLVASVDGSEVAEALVRGAAYVPGRLVGEPSIVDFGVRDYGSDSVRRTVVLRNTGDRPLSIFGVALERGTTHSGFHVAGGGCAGVLAAGAACSVEATYRAHVPFPFPVPWASSPGTSLREAFMQVRLTDATIALRLPLRARLPEVASTPIYPAVDFVRFERRLARLAASARRLIRGGPRRALTLATLKAPTAGRLHIRIAALGLGRRTVLARGGVVIERNASKRLRFRLTRKGQKLLRRPVRTRVKVTVAFRDRVSGVVLKGEREMKIRRPA